LAGSAIPPAARLLAAADVYQALLEPRPYRDAFPPAAAVTELRRMGAAGHLDPQAVRAVCDAAGGGPSTVRPGDWPDQLTDREVQVLRLAATGMSNRAIGAALHISPRTAEHHVQHIYAKIGVSTRAGTALYAMEHGLYRTDG